MFSLHFCLIHLDLSRAALHFERLSRPGEGLGGGAAVPTEATGGGAVPPQSSGRFSISALQTFACNSRRVRNEIWEHQTQKAAEAALG